MIRISTITVAIILSLLIVAGHAKESTRQLACTGSMIEPDAASQSAKTLRLSLGSRKQVALDLGQGDVTARVVSDNKIQLKFSAKDFTGEFFHYTNDLFLIYKSGHLARLTCKPEG
jgi:hypothetical protein